MQKPLYARKGDTFFTRSKSILGRLIRWGETDPGETNGTWANHTGVVIEDGYLIPPPEGGKLAITVEALWHTQKGAWWELHGADVAKGYEVRVFRPVPQYTEEEKLRFVTEANTFVGDRYGWWKLLGLLIDRGVFRGRKVISRLFFIKGRPICSFLAALVNEAARRRNIVMPGTGEPWFGFGMPAQAADPDEMVDFAEKHPNLWQEVK